MLSPSSLNANGLVICVNRPAVDNGTIALIGTGAAIGLPG